MVLKDAKYIKPASVTGRQTFINKLPYIIFFLIMTVSYKNILYHYLRHSRKGNVSTNIPFTSVSVIFDKNCTFVLNCPFSDFLS